MIWLAWRQFRLQALVVAGVLVILGILLAVDGAHLVHLYDTSVASCGSHGDCPSVTQNFDSQARWVKALGALVLVAPALIGVFWGAPLVARELETRTNRLSWTQSISRTHWFAAKLALVSTATLVVTGLLSLMVTWWASPYDRLQGIPYAVFDERNIVPVAYALFALALGVCAGVIIRRTLPAMAVTLVAFVAVRIEFGQWVRFRLIAPLHTTIPFVLPSASGPSAGPPGIGSLNPGGWFISQQILNSAGRPIGQNGGIGPDGTINFIASAHGGTSLAGVGACPNAFPPPPIASGQQPDVSVTNAAAEAAQKCVASFHLRTIVTFQPESRYWAFQWYEAAIFVGAAIVIAALASWWVRRRIT